METKAKLSDISYTPEGKQRLCFTLDRRVDTGSLDGDLCLNVEKWREKRSTSANALLWQCIDKIASALRSNKWDVYLMMLKRYGKFSYVLVRPEAVDTMKNTWRESEVLGDIDVNGSKATQLLCYYGSSTYDTKEFSRLLDGVISEMEEMRIPTPKQEEMDRLLEEWGKNRERKHHQNQ